MKTNFFVPEETIINTDPTVELAHKIRVFDPRIHRVLTRLLSS